MVIAAILACLGLLEPAPDEFQDQLARLSAPHASERSAAARWLEANLVFERYPELAEAARVGDAEVRGRLARILGSDDRHLALALELSIEKDPGLKALGQDSVRASVARSQPRLVEPPQRDGLGALLRRSASSSPPRPQVLDLRQPLGQVLEELELVGELPLGLTLDPRVAALVIRREEARTSGAWNEVLIRVAGTLGLTLEGHGLPRGRRATDPEGAFLFLGPRGELARSGVDLISQWLFLLAGSGDENTRAQAARNLVACGFPPAIEWMDRLVRLREDHAALEGLLVAAAKGRVAPALLEEERMCRLLSEAATGAGPRSARILCALARAGCYDAGGDALVPRLLAGFGGASARARWSRLFLMERNHCALPGFEDAVLPLLADPTTHAELRLQALHTLAASFAGESRPAPLVTNLEAIFELVLDEERQERLGRTLKRIGLAPPFPDPKGLPGSESSVERQQVLQAWLWQGETEPVAAHVVAWMKAARAPGFQGGDALAAELRPWGPRGAARRIDEALLRAGTLAPELARDLGRVRLLLGLATASEVPVLLAEGRYALGGSTPDLKLLGALSGYPVALGNEIDSTARRTLLGLLGDGQRESQSRSREEHKVLFEAIELAAQGLYAARRDEEGGKFVSSVRQAFRRSGVSKEGFDRFTWPPAPHLESLDVSAALARYEIPASL